jgi:hypothetical protein
MKISFRLKEKEAMYAKLGGKRRGGLVFLASVLTLIGLVACDNGTKRQEAAAPDTGPEIERPDAPIPHFDPRNFSHPLKIDNKWLPLAPGTQFILEGESNRGEGIERHRVVFTVTDLTKVVNGVRTVVMWDRDFNGDTLAESEITFFAQDDKGNVWLLGEYPEEYERGLFAGAPSTWIAGLAGAKGGILMPADPKQGAPPFLQGFVPDIDFQDVAKVHQVGQEVCVPAGCYKDVMVIDEWDPLHQPQDGHQLKYQAPGVGNIRVESVGSLEAETLVLIEVRKLSAEEMAQVRQEAIKLDRHAYEANARWEATSPVEPAP